MKTKLIIFLILPFSFILSARAGSATWNLSPTSGDWNTTTNWTPNTIPNSGQAVATFDMSNVTSVVVNAVMDKVDHITFTSSASQFTITVGPDLDSKLTFSGTGILNQSGVVQNFVTVPNAVFETANTIVFKGGASAGADTVFTNNAGFSSNGGVMFFDTSSAGNATIINHGGTLTEFFDNSTAENATVINEPQNGFTLFGGNATAANGTFIVEGAQTSFPSGLGAFVTFVDSAMAGTGSFTLQRGTASRANGGFIQFAGSSTADHGTFTAEGANNDDQQNAAITFVDTSGAGDATITLEGGLQSQIDGATMSFLLSSTAGNATLIASNGAGEGSGATITFANDSTGGTGRIELLGPTGRGNLIIDGHNLPGTSVGSIEGAGSVTLGSRNLTIGTNNLSTIFSGTIVDGTNGTGGSLSKVGTGTVTLSGANTYTGGTTVNSGALLVTNTSGSATGTGAINVTSGTLGGNGIIGGAVTVGTGSGSGAFLAPAFGTNKQTTLTLQSSLILQSDATYTYTFKANKNKARSDLVVVNGVTINNASLAISGTTQGRIRRGTILTVISNTSANPISGTFNNLAEGAIVNVNGNNLQASYHGGDGNDLTLTVVP
jgi:autotransporter-associated beta strand protein